MFLQVFLSSIGIAVVGYLFFGALVYIVSLIGHPGLAVDSHDSCDCLYDGAPVLFCDGHQYQICSKCDRLKEC